jgi:hypothetical protein
MFKFPLMSALAGLLCAGAALWAAPVAAQQSPGVPDFGLDTQSAWLMVGDELLAPPSGPGPVTFDKRHPYVDNGRALTPHTDRLHVVERYKLTDGGKMMEVRMVIDDPGAFTTPWSAIQRFRRVPREWTEDICAENNFDFLQYDVVPLPHADKPDF